MKVHKVLWNVVVVASALSASCAWEYDQIDKADVAPLETLVGAYRAAKPQAKRRVLFFSDCFGYNHHGGRCYGEWTFRRAGEVSGAWEFVQTHDVKDLSDAERLKAFDAIVFCNSSGLSEAKAPGLTDALIGFVKGGKGIALIHAGLDAFADSDRLLDLFGGYFRGHPWHEDGTWRFLNEQPANPVNASFRASGVSFAKADEIYMFPAFFRRKDCTVLVSVDLGDPATRAAEEWCAKYDCPVRPDHDYAVSWTRTVGKGRVFYTSFGHDRGAFLDGERLHHMFAGLQYVLGDLPEPGRPTGPDVAAQRLDWANGPWGEQLDKRVRAAAEKTLDFVVLGDSITEGWLTDGKDVWESHFGRLQTLNLGVSGDRTEHLLWRVTEGRQAEGWKAKTIFVMIGINNFGQVREGWSRHDTPQEAAKGTKAILDAVRTRHPESRIVLLGALPWAFDPAYPWVRDYNAALKGLAGGGVVFRDIGGKFLKAPNAQKGELFRDGLHPNAAGYEIYASEMERIMAE